MDEHLTIEIPDKQGRPWTIVFTQAGSPSSVDAAFAFVAVADGDGRIHRSTWEISRLSNALWSGDIAPQDRAERARWYMRGIARHYRRHFDAILAREDFTETLEDADIFTEPRNGTPIENIAWEIDDLLLPLIPLAGDLETLASRGGSSDLELNIDAPLVWVTEEPLLREHRDAGDPLVKSIYPRFEEFYREYEPLVGLGLGNAQLAKQVAARLHRVSRIGSLALRKLAEARETPVRSSTGAAQEPWPNDRSVHIQALTLRNLRCFQEARLELAPPEDQQGQWIVLLGENGMGKTTILRALALALLRQEVASAHLTQTSGDAPLIRNTAEPGGHGHVSVELSSGRAALDILRSGSIERLEVASTPAPRPLVLAYGCRRGSALGGPRREANPDPLRGADTLFDEGESLVHADTWLRDLKLAATSGGNAQTLFDTVCRTLQDVLLGVDSISVEAERTWVQGPKLGRVPLAGLSDGYLTTLGWTVDMLARWTRYARNAGYELDEGFNAAMPCVVLIDELDLHLHPRWQTEVITRLREAFPRTTFIATTHNPLTLHGTKPGEVHVITEAEDGTLQIVQRDLPPGIGTDQVLTGEWFGLRSTLDRDTQRLLEEHLELLRQHRPEDDPERMDIERQLRERLGHYADTPAERLAQKLVAEHLDADTRPVTDEDREALRKRYEQRVAEAAREASSRQGEQ